MRNFVAVITGPTATGKTKMGVELAKALNGEVVGADSMQIYKGMDIGTAKPTAEEMQGVPHHMVGIAEPWEEYSVSRYVQEAARCVDDIFARGKLPILVGGTGLYIESLLSGRDFAAAPGDTGVREHLSAEYDRLGGEEMRRRLGEFDPEAAARLHFNDKKRIVRAMEVWELTGKTITQHDAETKLLPPRYHSRRIALTFENREDLYRRIDRRVDGMYEQGLEREVLGLLESGLSKDATAMQAIGYKEILRALENGGTALDAREDICRESRRYAKRQLSWLGRDQALKWIRWGKEPDFREGLQISTAFLEDIGI